MPAASPDRLQQTRIHSRRQLDHRSISATALAPTLLRDIGHSVELAIDRWRSHGYRPSYRKAAPADQYLTADIVRLRDAKQIHRPGCLLGRASSPERNHLAHHLE
jgi:hypothetical protein